MVKEQDKEFYYYNISVGKFVKACIYIENVIVSRNNIIMYGDGNTKTVVSGNLSRFDHPEFTTYQTTTFCKWNQFPFRGKLNGCSLFRTAVRESCNRCFYGNINWGVSFIQVAGSHGTALQIRRFQQLTLVSTRTTRQPKRWCINQPRGVVKGNLCSL